MSDERFEQDEREDEEVEAHKKKSVMANDEPASDDESDEVEAHKKKSVMANDEPGSDDGSDEVEAHQHVAKHKNL
jgi:hypothetical protein